MKALSVQPYWATSILQKTKTVECRTWKTDYRGDLLICASSGPWWAGSIRKHALCVVELLDIVPLRRKHLMRWSDREVGEDEIRVDWDDWMNRLAKLGRRNGGLDD